MSKLPIACLFTPHLQEIEKHETQRAWQAWNEKLHLVQEVHESFGPRNHGYWWCWVGFIDSSFCDCMVWIPHEVSKNQVWAIPAQPPGWAFHTPFGSTSHSVNIPILPEIFNKETLILNQMDIILSTMGMFQVCDSKSVIRTINIALQVVSEHTRLPESTYQRATHGKSHWFCLNIGYVLDSRYNLLFAQCNFPFSLHCVESKEWLAVGNPTFEQ